MLPIIVGRIGSAYGVQGWAKVISYTDPKENIINYTPWQLLLNGSWQAVHVLDAKQHGNGLIVHLAGYHSPEAVRQIANAEIGIQQQQLPKLPPGQYYWADLIGLEVINTQGEVLGVITRLFETGANDVIVVKGKQEVLLPYIPHVVLSVDLEKKQMRVDWE